MHKRGFITSRGYDLMASACVLVTGTDEETGLSVYFAPVVATTITHGTVELACEIAEFIRKCGANARPVVCGFDVHPRALSAIKVEHPLVLTRERPK